MEAADEADADVFDPSLPADSPMDAVPISSINADAAFQA